MNVLWQIYEELFLNAEKSIFFHLNAPPKVTLPVYKTQAICKASDNVRRSLRKNILSQVFCDTQRGKYHEA